VQEVMFRFATQSSLPIRLDSTEPPVIETGLQLIGGRPILNSVNREDGDGEGTRLDRFLRLAKEYGAAVVCTCIDEVGQARDADWKFRAAKAIRDLAVQRYGLKPEDLMFDALALPLSTGMEESRRDGIETIEGIRPELDEAPAAMSALTIVNDHLLAGMKVVGDLFGSGQMQLPFVLQSAETMKAAVAYLEPHMEKSDQGGKGRIVLATVKGDV